jgi:uncharacterized membrane protein
MNGILWVHIIHALAAGIWLGGLVFTTVVVSPVFKAMEWEPAQRVAVRSAVGRQYTKVARVNLAVLLVALVIEASLSGWRVPAFIEFALVIIVALLSELHARVFAPRLGQLARSGDRAGLAKAVRTSIGISMFNLLVSIGIVALAAVSGFKAP